MSRQTHDIQGRFWGMPYDWRRPTWRRFARRMHNPGGPLFTPKSFGWGYALNLAHPKARWILGGLLAIALLLGLGHVLIGA